MVDGMMGMAPVEAIDVPAGGKPNYARATTLC
jgi:copper(I)-binding protein